MCKQQSLPEGLVQQVFEHVSMSRWVELSEALIVKGQPQSENPLDPDIESGSEKDIAEYVASILEENGLNVELHEEIKGRPNVVGTWHGQVNQPSLILNTHLDTYPAGDNKKWDKTNFNPYNPTVSDDSMYSRGTSDTRGNMACTLLAVEAIKNSGVRLKGTLHCVYTVNEEKHGPHGSIYLLDKKNLKSDYEITAEPTGWSRANGDWGMGLAISHCGNCIMRVKVRGEKSHLWRPDGHTNAIVNLSRLIMAFEDLKFTHDVPDIYGSTKPRVCVVRIHGGAPGEMQFTADECEAVIAVVGLVPGMTEQTILNDMQECIDRLGESMKGGIDASVERYPGSLFVEPTISLKKDDRLVAVIADAYREVLGETPELYRKNAYCDTIRFSERGINSVTIGPGEDGWPPINEYIDMRKVIQATKIYILSILGLLGIAN